MTEVTTEQPFVPIEGQCFLNHSEWVRRATTRLTNHPDYLNTEHDGPAKGWRGAHFTALCFDQKGRRCRNGGDFQRATDDDAYPIWWIWPDQIVPLIMAQRDENRALKAQMGKLDESVSARMQALGMLPLDVLLAEPATKYCIPVGMASLEAFAQWIELKHESYMKMRMRYETGELAKDDLYEWVFCHSSAFTSVHHCLRAALEGELGGDAGEAARHG